MPELPSIERTRALRKSWLILMACLAVSATALSPLGNRIAWALQQPAATDQSPGSGDAAASDTDVVDEAAVDEGVVDEGAVTEPAGQEAGGTEQDAGGAEGKTESKNEDESIAERRSFLSWLLASSGIFGILLLLLSFLMVALITMNLLQVRRPILLPTEFIDAFEQKLNAKDYAGAYDTARNDDSFVARVLAAGLAKLNRGYDEAIEGMQEMGEDENMAIEQQLSYLALIGSIAPMIGLTGTVYGMIMSFEEIANSPVQPAPKDLAEGISTALFTTLEGLIVAIPAMIAYSILRNRVSRLVLAVGMVSEGLMSRFSALGKTKSARSPSSESITSVDKP